MKSIFLVFSFCQSHVFEFQLSLVIIVKKMYERVYELIPVAAEAPALLLHRIQEW